MNMILGLEGPLRYLDPDSRVGRHTASSELSRPLPVYSSLQICLGDVMTNRVVDEVELCVQPLPVDRAQLVYEMGPSHAEPHTLVFRGKSWARHRWVQGILQGQGWKKLPWKAQTKDLQQGMVTLQGWALVGGFFHPKV